MVQSKESINRLCVALDVPTIAEAERAVGTLEGLVGTFKVGLELFSSEGTMALRND